IALYRLSLHDALPISNPPVESYGNKDNGGYAVHPVPSPPSIKPDKINNKNDGINNQKLRLVILGNAISGKPIINGTIQLPKPTRSEEHTSELQSRENL